jgi:Predicted integral membrane protein (DUF2269)
MWRASAAYASPWRPRPMDWADLAKLLHVAIAIVFISGLIGRWILLTRAARADDPESAYLLAHAAGPFEQIVIRGGPLILAAGLLTAWAQGYPWLGLTTGWMLASVVLLLSPLPFVPLVFLPRGKIFEAELKEARRQGVITPGLRAAFADPMVALARRWELTSVGLVVVLMVLKPF